MKNLVKKGFNRSVVWAIVVLAFLVAGIIVMGCGHLLIAVLLGALAIFHQWMWGYMIDHWNVTDKVYDADAEFRARRKAYARQDIYKYRRNNDKYRR